jgi:hypothetical protein
LEENFTHLHLERKKKRKEKKREAVKFTCLGLAIYPEHYPVDQKIESPLKQENHRASFELH